MNMSVYLHVKTSLMRLGILAREVCARKFSRIV